MTYLSKIAFLLGAGASIPAGMPSTSEITKVILSGERVWHHTDGTYYYGTPPYARDDFADEYVPKIRGLLQTLRVAIDEYYNGQPGRRTNYEDLHYVATQIHDSEMREYDNPVVQAFIETILPQVGSLLLGRDGELRSGWDLHELADETAHYIEDVVWRLVTKKPTRTDHLNCLKHACLDEQLSGTSVFTVNHDTVIEQSLRPCGIPVADGFGKPVNGVRYWNPVLLDDHTHRVRLLKLHGSIDWFCLRRDERGSSDDLIGIPVDGDHMHSRDPNGMLLHSVPPRPLLLIGTFNKMLHYTSGIYVDLYCRFHRLMRDSSRLVISGYSFGDKGINTRIVEWMYSLPDNRTAVVHPRPASLKAGARGAISNNWDHWLKSGKLVLIPKRIQDTQWPELKAGLTKP